MGQVLSLTGPFERNDRQVDLKSSPTFDSHLGFPGERIERVMIATKEEMDSVKLIPKHRDYCAHKLIEFRACKKNKFPFVYRCTAEKHQYLDCQKDDYVLRMKEFERERRLIEREIRKKNKDQSEFA